MHIIIVVEIKSMIKEIDTSLKGDILPIAGRHALFSLAEKFTVLPSTFQPEFSDLPRLSKPTLCI